MPTLLCGEEQSTAVHWLEVAARIATTSVCQKAKRGVVIVRDGTMLGSAVNGPPPGYDCIPEYCKPICSTYCGHAEIRAILSSFKNGAHLMDSRMYHARVEDGVIQNSRKPRCPDCSKYLLETGIRDFVLQHEEGLVAYTVRELHDLGLASLTPT